MANTENGNRRMPMDLGPAQHDTYARPVVERVTPKRFRDDPIDELAREAAHIQGPPPAIVDPRHLMKAVSDVVEKKDRLQDIADIGEALTYGEMKDLFREIAQKAPAEDGLQQKLQECMPDIFHAWVVSRTKEKKTD